MSGRGWNCDNPSPLLIRTVEVLLGGKSVASIAVDPSPIAMADSLAEAKQAVWAYRSTVEPHMVQAIRKNLTQLQKNVVICGTRKEVPVDQLYACTLHALIVDEAVTNNGVPPSEVQRMQLKCVGLDKHTNEVGKVVLRLHKVRMTKRSEVNTENGPNQTCDAAAARKQRDSQSLFHVRLQNYLLSFVAF